MNIDMNAMRILEADENIPVEDLLRAIKGGLVRAYKDMTGHTGYIRVDIDEHDGRVTVFQLERDEEGNTISEVEDTPEDFGRQGAQAVRDAVRSQMVRARAEQDYEEFASLVGTVVNGMVVHDAKAQENGMTIVNIGTEFESHDGIIMDAEKLPGEQLNHNDRIRSFVVGVTRGSRSPQINLSRTHPKMVEGLFTLVVPEVADGSVVIKSIAREAGHRSKVAVHTEVEGLNAKGALIGPRGQRVNSIMEELNGEKIDIINWDADPAVYIGKSLAPASTVSVEVLDPDLQIARAIVPDHQLSLAIGKEGQNVRLAARLTGWKIDIRSQSEAEAAGELPEVTRPQFDAEITSPQETE